MSSSSRLPSTMISNHGFIKYYFQVLIRVGEELRQFFKEVIIESPVEENLMVSGENEALTRLSKKQKFFWGIL